MWLFEKSLFFVNVSSLDYSKLKGLVHSMLKKTQKF